jgi:hypothetical protein
MSILNFDIRLLDEMASASTPSVEQMLLEIEKSVLHFHSLSSSSQIRRYTQCEYAPQSALAFVLSVNQLEDHGTRDLKSTQEALLAAFKQVEQKTISLDHQKTISTFSALEASFTFFLEQQNQITPADASYRYGQYLFVDHNSISESTDEAKLDETPAGETTDNDNVEHRILPLIVTADVIQEWHKIALPFAASHEFRGLGHEVCTVRLSGQRFDYLQSELVAARMTRLFDQWFFTMQELVNASIAELCPALIKFAAWVWSNFLFIHPFGNGNGRMARLMVQFVLNFICPFPVPIVGTRDMYLRCIEHDQQLRMNSKNDLNPPTALAHLILVSVWTSWQKWSEWVRTRPAGDSNNNKNQHTS